MHDAWKKLTGPQILFIAQAVANSSEDLKQLRIPLEWLQRGMTFVSRDLQNLANITQELAEKFPRFSQEVSLFLQEVDVPVTDIRVDPITREGPPVTLENEILDSDDADTQLSISAAMTRRTTLTHKTDLGEAQFDFKEESDGTQALIGFWLPWSMLNSKTKKSLMRVLVVDELDSSLHPKIVAYLIKKHLQIEKPTQLIFTTHDTHLMNTKLSAVTSFGSLSVTQVGLRSYDLFMILKDVKATIWKRNIMKGATVGFHLFIKV